MKKYLLLSTLLVVMVGCGPRVTVNTTDVIHDTITIVKRDTIKIHDTIYTSRNYGNVDKVIIGGN